MRIKKLVILLKVLLLVGFVQAQSYESIKNLLVLNQLAKAKSDVDKAFTDTKFTEKAEAYILKATVYAGFAADDMNKDTTAGVQLIAEAVAAFNKYKEMDPSLVLLSDLVYQNGPINIYSRYYTMGYDDYKEKKWETSYTKFRKAVEFSDILIGKKILGTSIDTNVLILAGITAENSGKKDDAAKWYSRLADNKIIGNGFESVYRFLVSYYFEKKNMPAFDKYKNFGGELYPQSEYFKFDKVDFAVGLALNFNDKLKALEEMLATDPNNFKANEVLGEIIYDTLNPRNPSSVLPSNAAALETKMVAAFNKAAAGKPDYENPHIYTGDHFINKAVKIDELRVALANELKEKMKSNPVISVEDKAKKDKLDKQYGDELEKARIPYEKAAAIFATRSSGVDKMTTRDKQQYKKACSYLADIAGFKKIISKGNPNDVTKYTAEEKKWNDLWESIK